MLQRLAEALRSLPVLLTDKEIWNTLDIDYEPPRVERLWCQWGEHRIFLHEIHPLDGSGAPLYHPHPWPSAVEIMSGTYVHRVGTKDRVLCKEVLVAGARYELTDPDAWHSVDPQASHSHSVMVIGAPYPVRPDMPDVSIPLRPLSETRKDELLLLWRQLFGWNWNE